MPIVLEILLIVAVILLGYLGIVLIYEEVTYQFNRRVELDRRRDKREDELLK